jgi:hypothetical protein
MKPVILTPDSWKVIRKAMHKEYPKSVFMLKSKMRSVLGFTVREHKAWVPKPDGGYSDYQIHLDFYSENKRTMFLLKYSELINKE